MVTEALDPESTVIWGARISDDMDKKLRVMTIITGVNSPYVLGKVDARQKVKSEQRFGQELGIEIWGALILFYPLVWGSFLFFFFFFFNSFKRFFWVKV